MDAIVLLRTQHREVEKLFKAVDKGDLSVVPEICAALEEHADGGGASVARGPVQRPNAALVPRVRVGSSVEQRPHGVEGRSGTPSTTEHGPVECRHPQVVLVIDLGACRSQDLNQFGPVRRCR